MKLVTNKYVSLEDRHFAKIKLGNWGSSRKSLRALKQEWAFCNHRVCIHKGKPYARLLLA